MALVKTRPRSPLKKAGMFDSYEEFDSHESVTFIEDKHVGLRGFIAIHNTNSGPAVGGTRFWYYESEEEALKDALRLSRAMTYKCALAGVPYGGGKAVLMAPKPGARPSSEYLAAYAARLKAFDCPFHTGEDVGLSEEDVRILAKEAPTCIIGRPEIGGMPSEWAALSVFYAMQAAMRESFGSDSFVGKSIAIRGAGNVGADLSAKVIAEGATVTIADIDPVKVARIKKQFKQVKVVPPGKIQSVKADLYAPCALGNEFKEESVKGLSFRIICGAANNQLANAEVGRMLHKRGILYVPDYVANAGGLINVVDELEKSGYSRLRVQQKVLHIAETVQDIVRQSRQRDLPTSDVADSIARSRFLRT